MASIDRSLSDTCTEGCQLEEKGTMEASRDGRLGAVDEKPFRFIEGGTVGPNEIIGRVPLQRSKKTADSSIDGKKKG